jgi:hypothetical protein
MNASKLPATDRDQIDDIADEMALVCVTLAATNSSHSIGISGPALDGLYRLVDRWETTLRTIIGGKEEPT